MAKKAARKKRVAAAEEPAEQATPALDRIAALLGLYVVKDMEADEAAVKLGNVGFSDKEIAALIGVTAGYVRLARFRAKKKGGRKPRKKAA
jgi:DNA-directed RNA polymerase specialized sigma24 family protein